MIPPVTQEIVVEEEPSDKKEDDDTSSGEKENESGGDAGGDGGPEAGEEGAPAVERYVNNFLKGGSSKDPIDLLAAAGVDMSTSKPIDDALKVFEEYLKKLEEG